MSYDESTRLLDEVGALHEANGLRFLRRDRSIFLSVPLTKPWPAIIVFRPVPAGLRVDVRIASVAPEIEATLEAQDPTAPVTFALADGPMGTELHAWATVQTATNAFGVLGGLIAHLPEHLLPLHIDRSEQGIKSCHAVLVVRLTSAESSGDQRAKRRALLGMRMLFDEYSHDEAVADYDFKLGIVEGSLGNYDEARERFEAARAYFEAHGPAEQVADCDFNLGHVEDSHCNYDEARERFEAARAYFEAHGPAEQVAGCDYGLGLVEVSLRNHDEARGRLQAARDYYEAHGLNDGVACSDHGLGILEASLGNYDKARSRYEAARDYYEAHGPAEQVTGCDYGLGIVEASLGNYDKARGRYEAARDYYEAHGLNESVANCDFGLGTVERTDGHYDEARGRYEAARDYYEAHGLNERVARCDYGLGLVEVSLRHHDEARGRLQAARDYFDAQDLDDGVARCDYGLGIVELTDGHYDEARGRYEAALAYFKAHGPAENVAHCEYHLAVAEEGDGHLPEALVLAVRAAILLDRLYYRLRRTVDRQSWAAQYASSLFLALRLAEEVGDKVRVAELIESARIQAVPVSAEAGQGAMEIFLAGMATAPDEPTVLGPVSAAETSSASAALGEPLGPPHGVRLGDGVSLPAFCGLSELAEGVADPPAVVSVADVARQVGGEEAHWFGSWAVGGRLYWFLLSPGDGLEIGVIGLEAVLPLLNEFADALPDTLAGDEDAGVGVARISRSALCDPEREADLAWRLGEVLVPQVLRDLLTSAEPSSPLSLVVAPAPLLAQVPFSWLSIDEAGTRVIERATVRIGVSVGLLHDAQARRPASVGEGIFGVVDPVGDLLGNRRTPVPRRVAKDLSYLGVSKLYSATGHLGAFGGVFDIDAVGPARPGELSSQLQATRPAVLFYLGHACSAKVPSDASLMLEAEHSDSEYSLLQARALFLGKDYPMADRVVLIACGGLRQQGREWLGLAPAVLYAGAVCVLAGLWDLVWIPPWNTAGQLPTYALAKQALAAVRESDPAVSWRAVQLDQLEAWRKGNKNCSPLYWAGIAPIGFLTA